MNADVGIGKRLKVRTLLRNVPTGLYVHCQGGWTGNADEALDFKTMGPAIRFMEQAGLRRMELVFVSPHLSRSAEVPLELLGWGASISKRRAIAA